MGRIHGSHCRKKEIEKGCGYVEPIPSGTVPTKKQATQLVEALSSATKKLQILF